MTLSVESRADDKLESAVKADYAHLDRSSSTSQRKLSVEVKTAARLAKEFRDAGLRGYAIRFGNGRGGDPWPDQLVMMRAGTDFP